MFTAFKMSLTVVDILAFFGLETELLFEKLGDIFFKSSGHPGHYQCFFMKIE